MPRGGGNNIVAIEMSSDFGRGFFSPILGEGAGTLWGFQIKVQS